VLISACVAAFAVIDTIAATANAILVARPINRLFNMLVLLQTSG
jgi:hypothetical protein